MKDKIRWGIVGTGTIAHRFAQAVGNVSSGELVGVASRTLARADDFANEFGIEYRFGSYEEMAQSDKIDAAYIATPHGAHAYCAMLFLRRGKGVLCEKPMSVNASQTMQMISCARENKAFLMEAMWARVVPGTLKLMEIVNSGVLGEIRGVSASFCYNADDEPEHHVFKPENGGGSLLDVGVYGLYFESWYISSPIKDITAFADVDKTGTDVNTSVLIKHENSAIAEISSATLLRKPNEGYVFGTKGYVKVRRFYAPETIEINIDGTEPELISVPYAGNGFEEQIAHANRCMIEGKTESEILTLGKTLQIAELMDDIRRIIGVKYPQDAEA